MTYTLRGLAFAIALGIALLHFALVAPSARAQDTTSPPDVEQLHQELRDLRARIEQAFLAKDGEALLTEFTDDLHYTAINNEVVDGIAEAREYYARMMEGASSAVEDIRVTLEPDGLSTLHNDGQVAISTGNSDAYFKMRVGPEFSVPLRWTASLVRQDGAWKIASVHFSANILENPISGNLKSYVIGGAIAMALLGLIAGFLIGRRRASQA
jgi:uncharacterized protein (TIGR02246 family)